MFSNDEVEIVTGVNLPMIIKFASVDKEMSLNDLAREDRRAGKTGDLQNKRACLSRKNSKRMLSSRVTVTNDLGLHRCRGSTRKEHRRI